MTKGAIKIIFSCYPPSNGDSYLLQGDKKYFFEAAVRLEQIRRLKAGYRIKGGVRILCIPCGLWFGGVSFEQYMRMRRRSQATAIFSCFCWK